MRKLREHGWTPDVAARRIARQHEPCRVDRDAEAAQANRSPGQHAPGALHLDALHDRQLAVDDRPRHAGRTACADPARRRSTSRRRGSSRRPAARSRRALASTVGAAARVAAVEPARACRGDVAARLVAQQRVDGVALAGSRCSDSGRARARCRGRRTTPSGDERAWCGATRAPQASHPAVAAPRQRAQAARKSSPLSSRKRRTEASWCSRRSAIRRACSAARCGEVLEAALGVVGQRIDVRDVLLRAGDAHRRPALGERAGAAHRRDGDVLARARRARPA